MCNHCDHSNHTSHGGIDRELAGSVLFILLVIAVVGGAIWGIVAGLSSQHNGDVKKANSSYSAKSWHQNINNPDYWVYWDGGVENSGAINVTGLDTCTRKTHYGTLNTGEAGMWKKSATAPPVARVCIADTEKAASMNEEVEP